MTERWPAALRLEQAAEYSGLSVDVFLRVCPVQPMDLADGRYLRLRIDEWKDSLPYGWKPEDDLKDVVVLGKQPGLVYVVGFASYVKIGYTSKSIEERIIALQTGCPEPITVYATLPGSKQFETHLHQRFDAHKTHGEWFRREGELAAWIDGGCK